MIVKVCDDEEEEDVQQYNVHESRCMRASIEID